jgi:replicative DNA helicase
MLLLSQLNRESEKVKGDNRPKISQARGAGIWEELAFVGACLYREVKSKPARNDLRNVAELILEKNRSGEDGTIPLKFEGWAMRFSDADDVAPAPPDETGD